jgi:hypothetical protein
VWNEYSVAIGIPTFAPCPVTLQSCS